MNIDITNYGHYRLTSHGGWMFYLFNRQNDKVYTVSRGDYSYIKGAEDKLSACLTVEREYAMRSVP